MTQLHIWHMNSIVHRGTGQVKCTFSVFWGQERRYNTPFAGNPVNGSVHYQRTCIVFSFFSLVDSDLLDFLHAGFPFLQETLSKVFSPHFGMRP